MKRGKALSLTALSVLRALASGRRYGFDVMDATGLASGTVYPTLSRLERSGFIRARWEEPKFARREKRPPRRYYEVTRAGSEALRHSLERYRAVLEADMREPEGLRSRS